MPAKKGDPAKPRAVPCPGRCHRGLRNVGGVLTKCKACKGLGYVPVKMTDSEARALAKDNVKQNRKNRGVKAT
jgi:hypothetical protein